MTAKIGHTLIRCICKCLFSRVNFFAGTVAETLMTEIARFVLFYARKAFAIQDSIELHVCNHILAISFLMGGHN